MSAIKSTAARDAFSQANAAYRAARQTLAAATAAADGDAIIAATAVLDQADAAVTVAEDAYWDAMEDERDTMTRIRGRRRSSRKK